MTGIERLRRLARSQNMDNAWTAMLAHELCDIADQIECERECERDTIENLRLVLAEAAEECGMDGMVEAHVMTNAYQGEFRDLEPDDDGYASFRVGGAGWYSFDGGRTWSV